MGSVANTEVDRYGLAAVAREVGVNVEASVGSYGNGQVTKVAGRRSIHYGLFCSGVGAARSSVPVVIVRRPDDTATLAVIHHSPSDQAEYTVSTGRPVFRGNMLRAGSVVRLRAITTTVDIVNTSRQSVGRGRRSGKDRRKCAGGLLRVGVTATRAGVSVIATGRRRRSIVYSVVSVTQGVSQHCTASCTGLCRGTSRGSTCIVTQGVSQRCTASCTGLCRGTSRGSTCIVTQGVRQRCTASCTGLCRGTSRGSTCIVRIGINSNRIGSGFAASTTLVIGRALGCTGSSSRREILHIVTQNSDIPGVSLAADASTGFTTRSGTGRRNHLLVGLIGMAHGRAYVGTIGTLNSMRIGGFYIAAERMTQARGVSTQRTRGGMRSVAVVAIGEIMTLGLDEIGTIAGGTRYGVRSVAVVAIGEGVRHRLVGVIIIAVATLGDVLAVIIFI